MKNVKITCLSINCPERFSLCCQAYCTNGKEGEAHFVCSKCRKEFKSPPCHSQDSKCEHPMWVDNDPPHRVNVHCLICKLPKPPAPSWIDEFEMCQPRHYKKFISKLLSQAVEAERLRIEKKLHKIAMFDNGDNPKYAVKDILEILK